MILVVDDRAGRDDARLEVSSRVDRSTRDRPALWEAIFFEKGRRASSDLERLVGKSPSMFY